MGKCLTRGGVCVVPKFTLALKISQWIFKALYRIVGGFMENICSGSESTDYNSDDLIHYRDVKVTVTYTA